MKRQTRKGYVQEGFEMTRTLVLLALGLSGRLEGALARVGDLVTTTGGAETL